MIKRKSLGMDTIDTILVIITGLILFYVFYSFWMWFLPKVSNGAANEQIKEANEYLVNNLNSNDDDVRITAIEMLGKLEISDNIVYVDAIEPLISFLSDDSSKVRSSSAYTLAMYALNKKLKDDVATNLLSDAINPIITLLSDEDTDVRWSAAHAIQLYALENTNEKRIKLLSNAINPIITLLSDTDKSIRIDAAVAIANFAEKGITDPNSVEPLALLLSDENDDVAMNASCAFMYLADAEVPEVVNARHELEQARNRGISFADDALWRIDDLSEKLSKSNKQPPKNANDDSKESLEIADDFNSELTISRETEHYQGYIRLKVSVNNKSSFVVSDVALDFHFDEKTLRIDRHEPNYKLKDGKLIIGNLAGNSSKTVAVYFDPMICSKGTAINCLVTYNNAKGQLQTTQMKTKSISVICPIMRTDSDINIGRLKELIDKLPYRDSKVYQVQTNFDAKSLLNVSREVLQKHDVKHIRTLSTKGNETFELWYYGKTKVNNHDIVIKITISSETQSIELFATTKTPESLTGLLAEIGRELKNEIENKFPEKDVVQQVINVSIKDSLIQRSNLLSSCDINGNCTDNVVIVDSFVQRSNIGSSAVIYCSNCGKDVIEGDKFCSGCGTKIGISSENTGRKIVSNTEVKPERKLEYKEVYDYLVETARKACDNRFELIDGIENKLYRKQLREQKIIVTYGDVLKRFGKIPENPAHQNELYPILDEINDNTKPILLSALVVNGTEYLPSKPFFRKWTNNSWGTELEKIWDYYCNESDRVSHDIERTIAPTNNDFQNKLVSILDTAEKEGKEHLDVRSEDLHKAVGGYPSTNHRMPLCCGVMKKMMGKDDEVLQKPPSGCGATLVIRYHLPRNAPQNDDFQREDYRGDNIKSLQTWGERSDFKYEGSIENGTTIYYGDRSKVSVSSEQYSQLINEFEGKSVNIGTSRDNAPRGSVGEWLQKNVTKTAIASYVGAILVDEGYATKGNKREIIEFL